MKAYPINEATVRTAVSVFTWLTRIAVPTIINANANRLALKVVISPCGSGRLEVLAIFASIFLSIIWLMVAAEDAHKPMPIIEIITKYNDGKLFEANNIPIIAVMSIIKTTFGFVSSR
jgi:hypothetical protein